MRIHWDYSQEGDCVAVNIEGYTPLVFSSLQSFMTFVEALKAVRMTLQFGLMTQGATEGELKTEDIMKEVDDILNKKKEG